MFTIIYAIQYHKYSMEVLYLWYKPMKDHIRILTNWTQRRWFTAG